MIPETTRTIRTGLIVAAAMLAGAAQAQSSDADRIKELERKVEFLMARINQLEQANTRDGAPAAAQQAEKIAAIEKHVTEISTGLSRRSTDEGLPIHGFADVGIGRSGEDNATFKGRKGAGLGTFDLYLTPQFGSRVKGLVELAFEADRDGGIATDLERLQVGYLFTDAATGWVGRFHTPYGYWNTAYHHGAQIQTSILRPRFLEFEDKGGILPAHTTGLWLSGIFSTGTGKLGYDIYAGNAPQINGVAAGSTLATANPAGFSAVVNAGTYAGSGTLNMRQSGSTSHRTSTGFNGWWEPAAADGLRVGLHGLRAEVLDDSPDANRTLLRMLGGYFAYTADPWEVLGEYYHFGNRDNSGGLGSRSSWAGYTQFGYNLGRWTPFARVERARLDQLDNYFAVQESGRSYKRWAAGIRYDVDPRAALKVEFAGTQKENVGTGLVDKYPELRLQYAISF